VNDYDVRVVRTHGEFTRHSHPETDEFFMVLSGSLTIRMDAGDVSLGAGDVYIVPRGIHHQPVSPEGATVLLLEPSATVNTGDAPSTLTADRRGLSGTSCAGFGVTSTASGRGLEKITHEHTD
jgi:mannose-6-phosphate isomerase-like protein (cupin superfamily)